MSMKKSKHIIALLLVVLLGLSVVGCGAPAKQSAAPASSAPAVSSAPAASSAPASSAPAKSSLRPDGVPADFPNKEIHYIYAFAAGTTNDVYFRLLADKVKQMEGWKYSFVVDYKEGASGKIGWTAVGQAKPDGYTIGFTPSAMLISSISQKAPYGIDKIDYVANMMTDPGAIAVGKDSPYKNLKDLVEAAKKNPGKISFGVTSVIGQEGLTLKLIEKAAGVKFNIVPFNGEPEIIAGIVGKRIDALCLNITDVINAQKEGQLTIISTGADKRSPFLPDVPTYKESGYDVTQVNMRAIGAPKGIPEPIRKYLENCFVAASKDPDVQKKIAELKIPVDAISGTEVKTKFTTISNALQTLWNADPWEK